MGNWRAERGYCTDIIGPFELNGEVFVSGVVAVKALDDGESGEVLQEDYGRFGGDGHVVSDYEGEHKRAGWRDPYVCSAAPTGYLDSCGGGEAGWKTTEDLRVSVDG